jgi:hypothetical protein
MWVRFERSWLVDFGEDGEDDDDEGKAERMDERRRPTRG